MHDPADDGPEVRVIRREQVVQFVDWVEFHVGEIHAKNSWSVLAAVRAMLGLRTPRTPT